MLSCSEPWRARAWAASCRITAASSSSLLSNTVIRPAQACSNALGILVLLAGQPVVESYLIACQMIAQTLPIDKRWSGAISLDSTWRSNVTVLALVVHHINIWPLALGCYNMRLHAWAILGATSSLRVHAAIHNLQMAGSSQYICITINTRHLKCYVQGSGC